jgi:hypothetical protein
MRYEYKVLTPGEAINEAVMNALGRDGFHVVAVMPSETGGRVLMERTIDVDGDPILD